jgi:GntR family transcriptional repressor for pyruvate dehydrogenase complex
MISEEEMDDEQDPGPPERHERPSVSDYVTDRVVDLIRREELGPGDRLPSVQEMARRFSVASPTMRESLRRLQAIGMLDIRHGSGVYLKRRTHPVVLPNPHAGRLSQQTILDLLDARLLIEPQLADLAARRVTDDGLRDLIETLAAAAANLAGEDRLLGSLNMDFHRQVALLSGNSVLAQVIDSLVAVYEEEQLVVLRLYGNREQDYRQHLGILEAITERDAELSRRRMHDHLEDVRQVLVARLAEEGGWAARPPPSGQPGAQPVS